MAAELRKVEFVAAGAETGSVSGAARRLLESRWLGATAVVSISRLLVTLSREARPARRQTDSLRTRGM